VSFILFHMPLIGWLAWCRERGEREAAAAEAEAAKAAAGQGGAPV
jgi:hypothetical protein